MKRLLIIGLITVLGCASISSNRYSNPDIGFSINIPSGWKYDEDGSKEITRQANMETGPEQKGVLFIEPEYDPFFHMMFVIVGPNKGMPISEKDQSKYFKSLIERYGNKTSQKRVLKINECTALQIVTPQSKYEGASCLWHCTLIFTKEQVFTIVFLVPDSLRKHYEKVFDSCIESFRVIK